MKIKWDDFLGIGKHSAVEAAFADMTSTKQALTALGGPSASERFLAGLDKACLVAEEFTGLSKLSKMETTLARSVKDYSVMDEIGKLSASEAGFAKSIKALTEDFTGLNKLSAADAAFAGLGKVSAAEAALARSVKDYSMMDEISKLSAAEAASADFTSTASALAELGKISAAEAASAKSIKALTEDFMGLNKLSATETLKALTEEFTGLGKLSAAQAAFAELGKASAAEAAFARSVKAHLITEEFTGFAKLSATERAIANNISGSRRHERSQLLGSAFEPYIKSQYVAEHPGPRQINITINLLCYICKQLLIVKESSTNRDDCDIIVVSQIVPICTTCERARLDSGDPEFYAKKLGMVKGPTELGTLPGGGEGDGKPAARGTLRLVPSQPDDKQDNE